MLYCSRKACGRLIQAHGYRIWNEVGNQSRVYCLACGRKILEGNKSDGFPLQYKVFDVPPVTAAAVDAQIAEKAAAGLPTAVVMGIECSEIGGKVSPQVGLQLRLPEGVTVKPGDVLVGADPRPKYAVVEAQNYRVIAVETKELRPGEPVLAYHDQWADAASFATKINQMVKAAVMEDRELKADW